MSKNIKRDKSFAIAGVKSPAVNKIEDIGFRRLIENSHEGIQLLDRDLLVIYQSASAERINGWSEAHNVIYAIDRLVHPDDLEQFKILLAGVLASPGISKTCIFRSKHFGGHYIWLESVFTNFLHDPDINAIVCNFRDITERKVFEEKKIESERFTKTVTDNLPAMIAYWSADLHCLFANKPYLDWFEKQPHEMLGINKRILLNKEEFKLHELHIREVLKGRKQRFERTFHKADGRAIDTDTQYLPDLEDGEIQGFFSLMYDVTIVKLAQRGIAQKEKELESSERKFRALVENNTDAIVLYDRDRRPLFVSQAFQAIMGYDIDDVRHVDTFTIMHPDDVAYSRSALAECISKPGIPIKNIVYRMQHKDGRYIWLNGTMTNLLDDPAVGGIVNNFRDITKSKEEEQHLKLLESVITNATDAVLITEATPLDEPGPRIVYVNDAFTKMSGYAPEEVLGKTPRILQGAGTDRAELKKLRESMVKKEPCEITTINYKKNGDEFWINITLNPVFNEQGLCTHFIAIERDVTELKNNALQQDLLAQVASIFAENSTLKESLSKVLESLVAYGNFSLAEFWLVDGYKNTIKLEAQYYKNNSLKPFADETLKIKGLEKGAGLPGITWQSGQIEYWNYQIPGNNVRRHEQARNAGIKRVYCLPLLFNEEVVGTLTLLLEQDEAPSFGLASAFENFSKSLGAQIRRKQLEDELNQVFNFTPDILCVAHTNGYFTKVNPAMTAILEYGEDELLTTPFMQLVHPNDRDRTFVELQNIIHGKPTYYIENRYITKSGKIKWLAWTTTGASEQGTLYCSAKDITDKQELEELLNKANNLARIGSWEIDLANETVYWSYVTCEIHEAEPGYRPDIPSAMNFYKKGLHRDIIVHTIENAKKNGVSGDVELQIVTAKGNARWVRVIVEAEFAEGECLRLYGSIQDIDARKRAEIEGKIALEERNTILESIDDAFFAVDKSWKVTYWNARAEKDLQVPRDKIINQNLWSVFNDSIDSESFNKYHEAVENNHAVHFEDYYKAADKWYEVSAYPSATGLSVYFKDVTTRKLSDQRLLELNEELQKHAKELAISNAELEQFAYVASHDLQEPLRMVTSFMTQLEKKYGEVVDDKGRQYIHFAVDGAKRMRQIILDLLDFSRVGKTDDDLEDVDFNQLMVEILALYRRQMEELDARILFENLPVMQIYKTPIRQVLQNLVGNSLKYHRAGEPPLIKVSCKETQNLYQFTVKDNGIGIAPEYFDKIFIIFQRLHNKEQYTGTGMGLAIAKKIIENLGGKIWVKAEEGKGSTFYFTLLKNKSL